jgi:hypothetical protein
MEMRRMGQTNRLAFTTKALPSNQCRRVSIKGETLPEAFRNPDAKHFFIEL